MIETKTDWINGRGFILDVCQILDVHHIITFESDLPSPTPVALTQIRGVGSKDQSESLTDSGDNRGAIPDDFEQCVFSVCTYFMHIN